MQQFGPIPDEVYVKIPIANQVGGQSGLSSASALAARIGALRAAQFELSTAWFVARDVNYCFHLINKNL